MEEFSTGTEPRVPAVKPESKPSSFEEVPPLFEAAAATVAEVAEVDKDLLCPICMQIIKDAFLTSCGHSFCYMCIITHLRNKSDCPCCSQFLTNNQLFPNFLLDKLLKKTSAREISKTASPVEQFRQALHQGYEVSIKEMDNLLSFLAEKKRKMEQEEAERNMQILLDFLHCLRKQKVDELNEVQTDLQFIKEDINSMEKHRIDLYHARDRYSVKLRMLGDDSSTRKPWSLSMDKSSSGIVSSSLNVRGGMSAGGLVLLLLFGLKHERLRLDQLRHADWFGIAGLAIGLGALTVMLEEGQREMWFESAMIVKLAIATVFGFALITIGQVRSAHPVLKLSLIFSRSFGSVFVLSLIIGVVLYGVTFLIPQFLSSMADYSALQSGKVVFVSGIPALMLMPFLPLAFKYLDVRLAVFVGMTLIGVSCAMDWHLTARSAGGDLTNSQLVRGFGQIFAMMFLNQAAISAVAPEDAGDASALFNAGRNLGGSIGLALMATLQDRQTFLHFNRLGETVSANAATTQEWFAKAMVMPSGEAGAYRQLAGQLLEQATVMAYNDLFFALGVAIAITTPLALFLRPISSDTQMAMH